MGLLWAGAFDEELRYGGLGGFLSHGAKRPGPQHPKSQILRQLQLREGNSAVKATRTAQGQREKRAEKGSDKAQPRETQADPEAQPPRPEVTIGSAPKSHTSRDFAKASFFRVGGGHGRLFVSCLFCVAGAGPSFSCLTPQPRTLHLSPVFWAAYGELQGRGSVWARKPGAACSAQGSDL